MRQPRNAGAAPLVMHEGPFFKRLAEEPPSRPPFLPKPRQIQLILLESYLELLLGFAHRTQIIQDAEVDRQKRTVLIQIPAFSCSLPYFEAIDFLCQSIREELLLQTPALPPQE